MALGTITPQAIDPLSNQGGVPVAVGNVKMTVTNVGGDSAYTAGGSTLAPTSLGLANVLASQCEVLNLSGVNSNNAASTAQYNTATGKLQCYTTGATGALNECGSVNLSNLTIQILAFGY